MLVFLTLNKKINYINMKEKIHYAIEAALAVAVISLFVLHFSGNKSGSSETNFVAKEGESVSEFMPVAYIDIDSLMENYNYRLEINELMTKNLESSQQRLQNQGKRLQTDIEEFQKKAQNGTFLNRERQMMEQERLEKRMQELQNLEAQLSQELEDKGMRLNIAMRQTIISHVQEYNKEKGFHLIYGKMGENIIYAKDVYNITAEVIDFLNRKYAASPELKPKD